MVALCDSRPTSKGHAPPEVEPALERLNPLEMESWDSLLGSHPGAGCFHSAGWARVLVEACGFRPCYFASRQGGSLRTLFAAMEVTRPWGGRRAIALPFSDECPPLMPPGPAGPALFEPLLDYGRARGWRRLEWRGGGPVLGPGTAAVSFHRHRLDLRAGYEKVAAGFDAAAHRGARKATAEEVRVSFSTALEALRRFYPLYCLTRRRHGLPPQPFAFFGQIHRHLLAQGGGFVAEACCRGKAVAAAVFLTFGRKAVYKFGASDRRHQELRANNLLFREAIRWLAERGFDTLDLGRTSLGQEGLRRFKLSWGCAEDRLDCYAFDPRRGRYLEGRDAAHGWHNLAFRLMPLSLARWMGSLLYRYAA